MHSSFVDTLMTIAAKDAVFVGVAILALLWLRPTGVRGILAAAGGALIALAVGMAISYIWYEPRPFVAESITPLIPHAADASFPSDHLCVLGAITGAVWLAWRRLALLSAVIALAVGVARVYAHIHYPVDVIGGFVFGVLGSLLMWRLIAPFQPLLDRLDTSLNRIGLRPNPHPHGTRHGIPTSD